MIILSFYSLYLNRNNIYSKSKNKYLNRLFTHHHWKLNFDIFDIYISNIWGLIIELIIEFEKKEVNLIIN